MSSAATKRKSAPPSLTFRNCGKLPPCKRTSTGTSYNSDWMSTPAAVVLTVMALRDDHSGLHHAVAEVLAQRTTNAINAVRIDTDVLSNFSASGRQMMDGQSIAAM